MKLCMVHVPLHSLQVTSDARLSRLAMALTDKQKYLPQKNETKPQHMKS